MDFHETRMGHDFFEHLMPQLIQAIQALTAALDKPAQAVTLPVKADPEFLSLLYYGNYEPSPFQQTPEGAKLIQAINTAHKELEALLPEGCHEKLVKYQDALTTREGIDLQMAYESGFRTAVQMIVAGLSHPTAEQAEPDH